MNPGTSGPRPAPMGWLAATAWLVLIAGALASVLLLDYRPAAVAVAVFLALCVVHGTRPGSRT